MKKNTGSFHFWIETDFLDTRSCFLPGNQIVRLTELNQLTDGKQLSVHYCVLYNNQINARALIGQSAMFYCASKLMERSRVF